MRQGRYAPLPAQAPISGKAQPDLLLIEKNERNEGDHTVHMTKYSGGNDKNNFFIMPGEILIGRIEQNNHYSYGNIEMGITSVAGLNVENGNVEAAMRNFYFMGVVTTEWEYGGEGMYGTEPLDHGFGFQRAGSCTINPASGQDIPAGVWLEWTFPTDPKIGLRKNGIRRRHELDTGFNALISRNKAGTPFGKPVIPVKVFDPDDYSMQMEAYYWSMQNDHEQGGCKNMTWDDYDNRKHKFNDIQLEAFAWTRGLLCVLKHKGNATTSTKTGVLEANDIKELQVIFGKFNYDTAIPDVVNPSDLDEVSRHRCQVRALQLLTSGVCATAMAKMSRVIGKSMGGARAGESLDIVLMSLKIGF